MEHDRQNGIMALFFRIKYAEEKVKLYRRNKKDEAARYDEQIKYHEDMAEKSRQELVNLGVTEELLADLEEFYKENKLFKYIDNSEYQSTIA